MSYIKFERKGDCGVVRFSDPRTFNALSAAAIEETTDFVERLREESESLPERKLRSIVLSGEGKAFIAGANIKEMLEMNPEEAEQFSLRGNRLMNAIEDLPVPVIAAVNGYALGGGLEVALAADFIYASESAKLGLPEVTLGIMPGFGGIRRLIGRIGLARARELIYTGRTIDAGAAFAMGLVNRVVPGDSLMDTVLAVAEELGKGGPEAVKSAKRFVAEILSGGDDEKSAAEAKRFAGLFQTQERAEGMTAFLEKRKAAWIEE